MHPMLGQAVGLLVLLDTHNLAIDRDLHRGVHLLAGGCGGGGAWVEVDDATKKGRLSPYENRSYDALNTLIGGRLGEKRPDYCLTIIVLRCTEHL